MGTNYYLEEGHWCPSCGHDPECLHIGKSSAGWCFGLHVIPEEGLTGLSEWMARWSKPNAVIRNEYGETLTPDEMHAVITQRGAEGPMGLFRHALGPHCVAHGAGTWDLIPGEFS